MKQNFYFIQLRLIEYCTLRTKENETMFTGAESHKSSFLEQTKAAREERALEKKRDNAIIVIQSQVRGWLTRRSYLKRVL